MVPDRRATGATFRREITCSRPVPVDDAAIAAARIIADMFAKIGLLQGDAGVAPVSGRRFSASVTYQTVVFY